MKLNETSLTPLYQQLLEEIKYCIESGKYKYEEKIPTEPELSEKYGVSRITVRRAVDELCTEGYLVKKQGKGTFVCRPKMLRKIARTNDVQGFSEACRANNMTPGARVISIQTSVARMDEVQFFHIEENAKMLYYQRVRTADGIPIMLENNFFPHEEFSYLEKEDLNDVSLFKTLEKHGVEVKETVKSSLEIVKAESYHAKLLDVAVGEPLFYMNAYFTDTKGRPVFIGRQYMVGSRYVFHDI
ncbi:MAG: GntR family transcriptional regulator [Acetivibrio ethanolgignens]